MLDIERPTHVVAIVGGAVSGSVAAQILAEHGCEVVVFEQNERPYGKIEDGLPRWHTKLRRQEYEKIDERLARPNIHFVPNTRLGRDLDFRELATGWGFSAVLLANGAWRDRSLEVPGVDDYVGQGLVYQNPLIYWFNHKNERAYAGTRYEVPDGTLCVGGGLASIDVIKVIQLEIYERALRKRGVEATMFELEHEGIAKFLEKKAIDPKSLGVTDGLLIYRRRVEDMPLADTPASATPEQLKKAETIRRKILEVCRRKFLFRFEERRLSRKAVIEDGRLVGITVAETKVEGKKVEPIAGSEHDLRAPLIISSIGSVPERIPGISMKGESYVYKSWDTGEYDGIPGVFGIGNVVTGKGNIRDSFDHGEFVAKHLVENYLGIGETRDVAAVIAPAAQAGVANAAAVVSHIAAKTPLAVNSARAVFDRVRTRQRQVGFEGDYKSWIDRVIPADLE
jgi:NADPH-dependent glutamate synthase beta subunit-like oxidoreductase